MCTIDIPTFICKNKHSYSSFSSETKTLAVTLDAFHTFLNCRYCSATDIRRTDNDQTQSITKASKPILLPTPGYSECAHKSFSMSSENLITIYCCQNISSIHLFMIRAQIQKL